MWTIGKLRLMTAHRERALAEVKRNLGHWQAKGRLHKRKKLAVGDKCVPIPRSQSGWSGRYGDTGSPRSDFIPDNMAVSIGRIS